MKDSIQMFRAFGGFTAGKDILWRMAGLTVFLLWTSPEKSFANVYASTVRINSMTNDVALPSGQGVAISYFLNEPASSGVTIVVKTAYRTVRTMTYPSGQGTVAGFNSVIWNGRDDFGQAVPDGIYFVDITAASAGFNDWTQTSDDANPAAYVANGRGIAVNCNSNSLYYGRVYVANAAAGPDPVHNAGDAVGIVIANADGSFADDGFSDGGYPWSGNLFSPWKLEVASDDRVYVDDFAGSGVVVSFDPDVGSSSLRMVLRGDNYNSSPLLSGPAITGTGTNMQLWMADMAQNGLGVHRWSLKADGLVAMNDLGRTAVIASPDADLNIDPFDVAVDSNGLIYTIQNRITSGDPNFRLFRFPEYFSLPETLADWKTGSADDTMAGAHGIAVSRGGDYVAVAFRGVFTSSFQNGAARVFYASNGAPVATLTPGSAHEHRDVTWDNAGNLYAIDNSDKVWRVYSPPGANSATTRAAQTIRVTGNPVPGPLLSAPARTGAQFSFGFNGLTNVAYVVLESTNLVSWRPVATNISSAALRQVSVPLVGAERVLYRIQVGP
jgi:hypothetical protein